MLFGKPINGSHPIGSRNTFTFWFGLPLPIGHQNGRLGDPSRSAVRTNVFWPVVRVTAPDRPHPGWSFGLLHHLIGDQNKCILVLFQVTLPDQPTEQAGRSGDSSR